MFNSTTLVSNKRSVHFARPSGGCEQAKAMSRASFSPSKMRGTRRRALLAVQHRVRAALRPLLSNTGAHDRICAQGFGNLWIIPLRPQGAFIGPQEYPRLKLFLGRALAFPNQIFEPFPLVRAQFDNIKPLAHLRLRRFKSRQKPITHTIQFS